MMDKDAFTLRPIKLEDLPKLEQMATLAGPGFTSLPRDKKALTHRIERSLASFANTIDPAERLFLLICLHPDTQAIVGLSGIESRVGTALSPFYNFKISTLCQVCTEFELSFEHPILQLVNDFQTTSELVSLVCHPDYRGFGLGPLLSKARFLLLAAYPERFSKLMIAEIRGVSDEQGLSPFWQAWGKHFFGMTFREADALTVTAGKQFIADLMPRYPLYLELLPQSAQAVIGQPHPEAKRALQLLKQEGFAYDNYIDIFDAGPLVACGTERIKTRQACAQGVLSGILPKAVNTETRAILANFSADFTFTLGWAKRLDNGEIEIDAQSQRQLQISVGDTLWYVTLQ